MKYFMKYIILWFAGSLIITAIMFGMGHLISGGNHIYNWHWFLTAVLCAVWLVLAAVWTVLWIIGFDEDFF